MDLEHYLENFAESENDEQKLPDVSLTKSPPISSKQSISEIKSHPFNEKGGTKTHYTATKLLERLKQFKTDTCSPEKNDVSSSENNKLTVYLNILQDKETTELTSEWWQDKNFTQQNKLTYLFENQNNSDVSFDLNGTILTAHRFILSLCSPVFETMFSKTWDQSSTNPIVVPDIEVEPFKTMLQFAYTDAVSLESESVMSVLYIARKYQIKTLEYLCVEYLGENLTPENALLLLDQARRFSITFLENSCFQIIDQSTNDVLNSESFTNVSKDTLLSIIVRDSLKVNEMTLFEAVVKWANKEAESAGLEKTPENLKTILGDIIRHIRFPLMNDKDFAKLVVPTGLLSDAQCVELFTYFVLKNEKPEISFNTMERDDTNIEEFVINRFQRIESRWGYNGTPDRVKFQVDCPVFLKGFGLFGSMGEAFTYNVTIEVIKCNSGTVIAKNQTTAITNGKSETFQVLFEEPVEIQPNSLYIASVTMSGHDSFYGSKGLRQIIKQTTRRPVTIRFVYAPGNNNGTSVDDGQIPEFIFSIKS